MTAQLRNAQTESPAEAVSGRPAIQVTGLTKIYGPRGGAAKSGWFGGKAKAEAKRPPRTT